MFRKIKNSGFVEFMDMLEEVSKEFEKEINNPSVIGDYNLYEDSENAYIEVLLPGFDKSEITSFIKDNFLIIKAEKTPRETREYIVKNLSITDKEYKIPLRSDMSCGFKWAAELKNGILTYTVVKRVPIFDETYISIS